MKHDLEALCLNNQSTDSLSLASLAGCETSIVSASAWYADSCGFNPHILQNFLSLRFGHENVSTTILPLQLIQEEQSSVRKNGH